MYHSDYFLLIRGALPDPEREDRILLSGYTEKEAVAVAKRQAETAAVVEVVRIPESTIVVTVVSDYDTDAEVSENA